MLFLAEKLADIRGGGCTDLAFVVLATERFLGLSVVKPLTISIEVRAESSLSLSEFDIKLGLRFNPARVPYSESIAPEPIDFLGAFPILVLETGG